MSQANFCPLYLSSQKTPHKLALITEKEKITFGQLNQIADQIENYFIEKKLTAYSRGGVVSLNHWRVIVLLIVFYRRRIFYLPFNHNKPSKKLLGEIEESRCQFIITDNPKLLQKIHSPRLQQKLPLWIDLNSLPFALTKKPIANSPAIAKSKKINVTMASLGLYTSGSMGYEKLAVFSLKNVFKNSHISNEFLDYGPKDTWLINLPLYHISGLGIVFRWLLSGGKIALASKGIKKVKENDLIRNLKLFKLTHLSLVVTQVLTIARQNPANLALLKKLKKILVGGSSIPSEIWALTKKLPLLPTYGLTEAIAQVATYDHHKEHWLKILPFRKLKIAPDNQEILIHQSSMFLKYEKKQKSFSSFSNGWFSTGDKGEIKNNHLKVIGRLDYQFTSGGVNIQIEEIETSLMDLPPIQAALVLAEENETWGKVPIAFISLISSVKTIKSTWLKEKLSLVLEKYKIPKDYYLLPPFTGKINRIAFEKKFLEDKNKFTLLK